MEKKGEERSMNNQTGGGGGEQASNWPLSDRVISKVYPNLLQPTPLTAGGKRLARGSKAAAAAAVGRRGEREREREKGRGDVGEKCVKEKRTENINGCYRREKGMNGKGKTGDRN